MNIIKKFFGTDGIRGLVGQEPMLPELILKLGFAIGQIIKPRYNKVLIGKDPRISGDLLESCLCAGLVATGMNVDLLGVLPTPAVAFLTRRLQADLGIVISASHNPYYDNGIKLFDSNGNKFSDDLELVIEEKMQGSVSIGNIKQLGKIRLPADETGTYIEFCKQIFPKHLNLRNLKIVIDCANGANSKIAPAIFASLGAQLEIIADNPNGININVNCGSTNLKTLIKKVKEFKADLGMAFDGDGDRVIFVDSSGKIIDGDDLLFIIANLYITSGKNLSGVVGTIMSNLGLEKALAAMRLSFIRTKVGDRYIFEELIKRNWDLGGETSGHIICKNINSTGDGIIAALKVLEFIVQQNKSLAELLKPMEKYPQVFINVPIKSVINTKKIINNNVVKKTYKFLEKKLKGEGRLVLRPSGTEPLMRVMVEGNDKKLINVVAKELEQVILGVI